MAVAQAALEARGAEAEGGVLGALGATATALTAAALTAAAQTDVGLLGGEVGSDVVTIYVLSEEETEKEKATARAQQQTHTVPRL